MLTVPVLVLLIAGSRTALSAPSAKSAKPETHDFGPHGLIFDPLESARLPVVFELDLGQTQPIQVTGPAGPVERSIRLVAVREFYWPNYHIPDLPQRRVFRSAEVDVEVSGTRATLHARPFEMPQTVNGLRLYVETTRGWATEPQLDPMPEVRREVRFSCVAAGTAWGPSELRFPIRYYRWRANTYGNTWLALVPYNKHYYHRGEDFGAIPDRLEVLASLGGMLTRSPLPDAALSATNGDCTTAEKSRDRGPPSRPIDRACSARSYAFWPTTEVKTGTTRNCEYGVPSPAQHSRPDGSITGRCAGRARAPRFFSGIVSSAPQDLWRSILGTIPNRFALARRSPMPTGKPASIRRRYAAADLPMNPWKLACAWLLTHEPSPLSLPVKP